MAFQCSIEKPWGVHSGLRNDQDCPRCGWTAPGPKADALLDAIYEAEEREWLRTRAAELGWTLSEGDEKGARLAA
jgi:hypothetical protein